MFPRAWKKPTRPNWNKPRSLRPGSSIQLVFSCFSYSQVKEKMLQLQGHAPSMHLKTTPRDFFAWLGALYSKFVRFANLLIIFNCFCLVCHLWKQHSRVFAAWGVKEELQVVAHTIAFFVHIPIHPDATWVHRVLQCWSWELRFLEKIEPLQIAVVLWCCGPLVSMVLCFFVCSKDLKRRNKNAKKKL